MNPVARKIVIVIGGFSFGFIFASLIPNDPPAPPQRQACEVPINTRAEYAAFTDAACTAPLDPLLRGQVVRSALANGVCFAVSPQGRMQCGDYLGPLTVTISISDEGGREIGPFVFKGTEHAN